MSLISQSEINSFKNIFKDHFGLFAFTSGIFFKEPLKIVTPSSSDSIYPGYTNSSVPNFTYQPVSGVFPIMMVKDNNVPFKSISQTRNILPKDQIRIKVQEDAKNFIMYDGQITLIQIDDQKFNLNSFENHQHYFDIEYFYFILERIF